MVVAAVAVLVVVAAARTVAVISMSLQLVANFIPVTTCTY